MSKLRLRAPLHEIARAVYEVAREAIAPVELSIGGGTVLAARWGHRRSTDIEFFCRPEAYEGLGPRGRGRIERDLANIPGCNEHNTWCEDIATYCEIEETEVTILPRTRPPRETGGDRLEGTELEVQSNAEVLFGKLGRRMGQSGEVLVRDVYDIVRATELDPRALGKVKEEIGTRRVQEIAVMLAYLPRGWSKEQSRSLIEPDREIGEAALVSALIEVLDGETSPQ